MESWHVHDPFSEQPNLVYETGRVLTLTSGNAQNFAVEDEKQAGCVISGFAQVGVKENLPTEQKFPIPKSTLPSNGHNSTLQRRILARRAKRDSHLWYKRLLEDRPYLRHPKYLDYRNRKRQDTGSDGKPVWPDHLERSFQNALVAIPPMGRKKKSQHGKTLGRNELISNWILEETGEKRDRKQISSHIQNITKLFRGSPVPEWRAIVSARKGDDDNEEDDGIDFYNDSIADMVRSQRHLAGKEKSGGYSLHKHQYGDRIGMQSLTALCFSMWVSLPHNMNKALHDYTRIQSESSTAAPISLEEIKHWQQSFPDLQSTLDSWNVGGKCEIILFKCSLKMMSDFPPTTSKLGISLELDFRTPSRDNLQAFDVFRYWTCKTAIYQHGQLIQRTHRDCNSAEPGLVRPAFESAWWAQEFTRLTDKKRRAEDNKDEAAVAATLESSYKFFRSLTIMQEIYVSAETIPQELWFDEFTHKSRMAVLLWTFTQTPESNNVGTTSWQKVIPPRMGQSAETSPTIGDRPFISLPNDTTLYTTDNKDSLTGNYDYYDLEGQERNILCSQNDEELCQDGFMALAQHESNVNLLPMQFSHASPESYGQWANFGGYESFDSKPLPDPTHLLASQQLDFAPDALNASVSVPNCFHFTTHPQQDYHHCTQQERSESCAEEITMDEEDEEETRHPLSNFDTNTHRMLQEQLGTSDEEYEIQRPLQSVNENSQSSVTTHFVNLDLDEEAMEEVLMVASAIGDLSGQQYSLPTETIRSDHRYTHTSPRPSRPPLLGHHSFAGIVNGTESILDTPARNDFAHLIAHLDNETEKHSSDNLLDDQTPLYPEIQRPRSQPLPLIPYVDKVHNFDIDDCNGEKTRDGFIEIKFEDCA